jgi:hypothetical protein
VRENVCGCDSKSKQEWNERENICVHKIDRKKCVCEREKGREGRKGVCVRERESE